MESYSYENITTATTTLIKTGSGVLHTIVVNSTAAQTIIIYDSLTAAAPIIATLKASVAEGTYIFDVAFSAGLTIVTGGTSDLTATYK